MGDNLKVVQAFLFLSNAVFLINVIEQRTIDSNTKRWMIED
jgi:hypothetical protein